MIQVQKFTIKYYDTKLFQETSEVVSNEIYDIEEECKQRYYTYNTDTRSFKKRELIFDKKALPYESKKKSSAEENKLGKKSYTKLEKETKSIQKKKKKKYIKKISIRNPLSIWHDVYKLWKKN